jgi:hypothetical protein
MTLTVTRVTHACALLDFAGRRLLTDPWFSERRGYYRSEPLAFPPAGLPELAGVLVSHGHYDHFDLAAFAAYPDRSVPFVVKRGLAAQVRAAGFTNVTEVDPWEQADLGGADGTRIGDSYRLITTLLDWRRHPAGELIRLYHERWEIEVAYLALRHTLLGGYVLRSRDRAGAEQELWALLAVYQALRMAMTAAAEAARADPDRASFTAALESAREQVITARGIEDPGDPDDTGRIGHAVLAGLLPARGHATAPGK